MIATLEVCYRKQLFITDLTILFLISTICNNLFDKAIIAIL